MTKTSHLSKLWQGRIDIEEPDLSRRLHQHVILDQAPEDYDQAPVIIGFATDEGVRRNQGRIGAAAGPSVARTALANLCCSSDYEFYDMGDVVCQDTQLEQAQQSTADQISQVLNRNGRPFVIGGGHEIGWAGFLGVQQFLQQQGNQESVGILNFDAHFDLRNPEPVTSSGTPFRQAHEWCQHNDQDFNYMVVGLNPASNTDALFGFAYEEDVQWVEDIDCHWGNFDTIKQQLADWLSEIDTLYITLCLDVFPAASAPGVSAPAALGVEPTLILKLLQFVQNEMEDLDKPILLVDVAELNPTLDIDNQTAKLAARYLYQMMV